MADAYSKDGFWRRWVIHPAQGMAAYAVLGIARLMPLEAASGLGGWLGRTIGPRVGITKRARRNLRRAFPKKTVDEIEAIIRGMWDNLGRVVFEYPHLDRLRFDGADRHVEVLHGEYVDLLKDDGRSGILFSAHMANWEITAIGAIRRGLPVHLFYRAPNNPFVDHLFRRHRLGDSEMIPKGAAGARRALKLLGAGEHLAMLVDQKMNDGIAVPFFGRDAMTAPALAQLALKYNCPVVPAQVVRLRGARFRIIVHPPLEIVRTGDRRRDVAETMGRVNALIEGWIRENPEQWLWLHNRWPD